jgi:hypothetical protein
MSNQFNLQDIAAIDKQIETLLECKPLPESEVRALAEKVTHKADEL